MSKKIAIFGPPRSGTSWLSHMFNSHPGVALRFQPLFSYGHKGALNEHSSQQDIARFFEAILDSKDPFALMQSDAQKNYPVFDHGPPTHIVFKETRYLNVMENILRTAPDVKLVGIIRNPLATLASWMGAPKEFLPSWNVLEEWRQAPGKNQGRAEEYFGFDKWKEAATAFLRFERTFPGHFRLIRYEQLNAAPLEQAAALFEFCELPWAEQTTAFIHDSRSHDDGDPYSVYRNKTDDRHWRTELPASICDTVLTELTGTPLEIFLQA